MDFENKAELSKLIAKEDDRRATRFEGELVPAFVSERDENEVGPVPDLMPEQDKAPDPSALSAWVDDLQEYADRHRGELVPTEVIDRIADHAIDEMQNMVRTYREQQIDAVDEQKGMVPDFHADSALEGAAVEPHPHPVDDAYLPKPKAIDPDLYAGGGGGGGTGGGGMPQDGEGGDAGEGEGGDGEQPADLAAKPEKEKGRIGKLVDKVLRKSSDKPEKPEPPAPAKPDKK